MPKAELVYRPKKETLAEMIENMELEKRLSA